MPNDPREAIAAALTGLAGETSLRAGATALFDALGYKSERTEDWKSVEEFVKWLEDDERGRFTEKQRDLFDSWRGVEVDFQVTDEEIGPASDLFDPGEFDRGRAKSFLFVAAELEDRGRPYRRGELADMARAVNSRLPMPTMLLFRHGATLTLAAVHRRADKRKPDRDVLERVTLVKDIRAEAPHRAHIDILSELDLRGLVNRKGVRDFDTLHGAWERVLDIEELNKRFYKDLYKWFVRAVEDARFPDDGAGEGSAQRHAIRLVTRLLFIWFLKEKGLVPEDLFEEAFARDGLAGHAPERGDYYRAVLQNLFFATLNTEIDKRAFSSESNKTHRDPTKFRYRGLLADPDAFKARLDAVPFVNGGLFDCLDDFAPAGRGGRRIDAFTDNEAQGRDLHVPARLFLDPEHGLFPLFRRYKFTVEENTPLDREVALDPELLGRVFENLLAAYNPETRETARKASGSYYTPRHIVDYMTGEALAAALSGLAAPADGDREYLRDRLRYLLDFEDAFEDAATLFEEAEKESVVRAIAGLRVLDPAAGSGAFPMGVLHKLTLALRRLDPGNALWEAVQKERALARADSALDEPDPAAREEELREISRTFETYKGSDYGRKLYLIQNGIFGVDIQPVACQIAKLRFFVSLVVEQETDDEAENRGIRPLPNLETRLVAADALLGVGKAGDLLRIDRVEETRRGIAAVRERYFLANDRRKKLACVEEEQRLRGDLNRILDEERENRFAALEREIEDGAARIPRAEDREAFLRDERRKLERLSRDYDARLADARKVAAWDPYDRNAHAGWFDPEYMFGVSGGFDIAIGNPPYIRGEKIAGKPAIAAAYGDFHRGGADIYTYFFRRGADLLAANGALCFITSNKFMRAEYGAPLRAFLRREAPPELVFDFGRTGSFDATVRPAVVLVRKAGNGNAGAARAAVMRSRAGAGDPAAHMAEHGFDMPVSGLRDSGWVLAEPELLDLREKIAAAGEPLGEYLENGIYRGIVTGLNEAFVIDAETRDRLVEEDAASETLIRPWLRGRDVRRWRTNWSGQHLIFARHGTTIERYPAIERHLSRFRKRLEARAHNGPWFALQANIAYHAAFDLPKIVYPIIGTEMRGVIDRENCLTNDKCFILPGDDPYLLALLNSAPLDFWFRLAMPCLDDPFAGGDMEFRGVAMKRTPIPAADAETRARLAALAERAQAAREADPAADIAPLQSEIDRHAAALYGLTAADRALIEQATARG